MAASKSEIRGWLHRGIEQGATHVICVCDTFDWEDYPVFVSKDESVHERLAYYERADMQTVMEVYNLSMDIEAQLNSPKAWNINSWVGSKQREAFSSFLPDILPDGLLGN